MNTDDAKRILQREFFPSYEEALQAFHALTAEERKAIFIHKTRPVFEIFNRTYVNALAAYILASGFRTVLEVGAGDGRLGHYLEEAIHRVQRREKKKGGKGSAAMASQPVRVIPVDNGTWNIIELHPVERLDLNPALEKYNPDLVIWCWMPIGDWTWVFRQHPSVREYLLIGETDGGFCGNDDTWNRSVYEADGFRRHDLSELSQWQLARNDENPPPSRSRTVAFRRGER